MMGRCRWLLLVCCALLSQDASRSLAQSQLELVAQTGHGGPVRSVEFSRDGKWLVTGANDRTSILWDVARRSQLRKFEGNGPVLSPNATQLAAGLALGEDDGETALYETVSGRRLRTIPGRPLAFHPAGDRLVTVTGTNVFLWETATGRRLTTMSVRQLQVGDIIQDVAYVYWAAFHPDGKYLVTCSGTFGSAMLALWDVAAGKRLVVVHCGMLPSRGLFVANGTQLLTHGSKDNGVEPEVITWEIPSLRKGRAVTVGRYDQLGAVSPDLRRIVTGCYEFGKATLFEVSTGKELRQFAGKGDASVAWSPDGKLIASGFGDGSAVLWNADTGEAVHRFSGSSVGISSMGLGRNGMLAANSPDANKTAVLWNLAEGKLAESIPVHEFGANVILSPDGGRLVTMEYTHYKLWDTAPLKLLHTFSSGFGPTPNAFTPDGSRLLASSLYDEGLVNWDVAAAKQLPGNAKIRSGVYAVSRDGRRVITGASQEGYNLEAWDLGSDRPLRSFPAGTYTVPGWPKEIATSSDDFTCASFSPDGRSVVLGHSSNKADLWSIETGKLIYSTSGHAGMWVTPSGAGWNGRIRAVDFAPDGTMFATASDDRTAIVWNAASGKKVSTLVGHTHRLNKVSFLEDSRRIVTGSADGTIRLWDAATGKELLSLFSFEGGKEWLAVTPEGLFDGSINAPRYVAYRLAGTLDFVPLERYQQKFYQPGLVASIWKGGRPEPKVDITKSLPPKVRFGGRIRPGMELKESRLDVEAIAETRSCFPVKAFRLLVDGRPYGGQNGVFKPPEPKVGESTATWQIELDPGRHKLKVLADTEYVQGASDEIEVVYRGAATANPDVRLPSLFVLAVGISKYPATRRLDYAALDAESVATAYQKHSSSLYEKIEVKVLSDEQATRKDIFQGLQWLRGKMTSKSVGVFFFAGHGEKDKDGSLYFLPVDFEEQDLAGSAIDADVLKKQLAGIPGRLTMILDACHAGSIDSGKTRGGSGLTDQLVRDLTAEENGLVVMCSALGHEQAQESHQFRHGVFTVALLEGLEGKADKTSDGAVYLTALDAHVARRVKELTKGQQNPVTGKPTSVRDFPVSRP